MATSIATSGRSGCRAMSTGANVVFSRHDEDAAVALASNARSAWAAPRGIQEFVNKQLMRVA